MTGEPHRHDLGRRWLHPLSAGHSVPAVPSCRRTRVASAPTAASTSTCGRVASCTEPSASGTHRSSPAPCRINISASCGPWDRGSGSPMVCPSPCGSPSASGWQESPLPPGSASSGCVRGSGSAARRPGGGHCLPIHAVPVGVHGPLLGSPPSVGCAAVAGAPHDPRHDEPGWRAPVAFGLVASTAGAVNASSLVLVLIAPASSSSTPRGGGAPAEPSRARHGQRRGDPRRVRLVDRRHRGPGPLWPARPAVDRERRHRRRPRRSPTTSSGDSATGSSPTPTAPRPPSNRPRPTRTTSPVRLATIALPALAVAVLILVRVRGRALFAALIVGRDRHRSWRGAT